MNETLAYSVVDTLYQPLPRNMSDDWNGDWFTADLSNYATLLTNFNGEPEPQETTSAQLSASHVPAEFLGRYQYEYGRSFGAHQTSHLPMRRGGLMSTTQQASPQVPSSMLPSPRFAAPNGPRTSTDRSQPPTLDATALPPILPSQKLHAKPASSSTSAYTPQVQVKRGPPDVDSEEVIRSPKRRPSGIAASVPAQISTDNSRHAFELSEEERLLVQLKQDQNLPWKEIAKEFEDRFGRPFQVPALQMRYKRLRERLRCWTNEDIAALEAAHDYWASNKFEIIANKMLDFGVQDRWPARYCERKWEQLHPDASKPDTGTMTTEKAKSQQAVPTRFDTDMQNHSIEWSIPSPPREGTVSQATSPLSGLALTQSTILPVNPFLHDDGINPRPRYDPT